jgi:SAM-dependent methyltransferase
MPNFPYLRSIHVNTQKIVCPTCGVDNSSPQFRIDVSTVRHSSIWIDDKEFQPDLNADVVIVKCLGCGLSYVNPQPRLQSGQMPYSHEAEMSYFNRTRRQREKAYRELFSKIPNFLGRPVKSHLDFGCGDGIMIGVARGFGVSSSGTEISQPLIKLVNQRYGPDTIISPASPPVGSETFDVITIINVIEHVTQPLQLLDEMRQILQSDGILLLHTINMGGIPARILKQNWPHIEPLGHLFYFTKGSLEQMLRKSGFKVVGRFDLNTGGCIKQGLHELLGWMNLHIDNGLGVVARTLSTE